ncbi:hypothetical protein PQR21_33630 [Paraburkholderia nemoris]|uniref:hypothetical protein n=1 Tax=Paraburkholderia nemoris TaxID=2793076 RepID=UPI001909615C|nr:hypothetical protein [Paraburkholderia nemoris]MBK3743796.1 hypothetical protein [Paraburkholderia aspalathi]
MPKAILCLNLIADTWRGGFSQEQRGTKSFDRDYFLMRNASRFDAAFQVSIHLTIPGTDAEISDRWSRNLSLMIAGQAKSA